jgi:hypothetical protein
MTPTNLRREYKIQQTHVLFVENVTSVELSYGLQLLTQSRVENQSEGLSWTTHGLIHNSYSATVDGRCYSRTHLLSYNPDKKVALALQYIYLVLPRILPRQTKSTKPL